MQRYRGRILAKYGRILSVEESPATRCGRQIGIWRADFHRTLAPRIYEGGARRARGVPHPDAEKFLFEAVCPDFGLKQLPGWVCSSPPSVRTGVLRIMVRLPPAIVYYRFAARSTTELWCDCHWQSFIIDSLRGAPPLANEGSKDSGPSVCQIPICRFAALCR